MSDKGKILESERRVSSRSRKMTDKGFLWQVETLQKNFRQAVSAWNTCCNKIEVLLSDSRDNLAIRNDRDILSDRMNHVNSIFKQVTRLIETECQNGEHGKLASDIETDIVKRYEMCENGHSDIMKRISLRLRELVEELSDSSSRRSRRSGSLKSSRHSQQSQYSMRSETAIKAAELRAKLKFIDMESKARLELEKIQTLRQLETAEAKLKVVDGVSQGSVLDGAKASLPQADILDRFLDQVVGANTQDNTNEINENIDNNERMFNVSKVDEQQLSTITQDNHGVQHVEPNIIINNAGQSSNVYQTSEMTSKVKLNTENVTSNRTQYVTTGEPIVSSRLNPTVDAFLPRSSSATTPVQDNYAMSSSSNQVKRTDIVQSDVTIDNQINVTESVSQDNSEITHLAKVFAEQLSLSRLPPPEPSVFCGDPLKYLSWKSAFQTLIERKQIPPSEKIHYLRKYISENVREVVENLFVLSDDNAYNDAKKLLDERYGESFTIANAFRNKLENWPKILSRDGPGLRKFADFIKQCLSAMKSIGYLNVLNDDRENRKLLTKLPDWAVNRWSRIVAQYREENHIFPPFEKFVEFVEKEAKVANDPVTSVQSLKADSTNSKMESGKVYRDNKRDTPRRNALATKSTTEIDKANTYQNKDSCFVCHKAHNIDKCDQFLSKSISERKDFAKQKGLCFGCLRYGHPSKRCNKRKRCAICSRLHPTSLHGDVQKVNTQCGESKTEPTPTSEVPSEKGSVLLNYSESTCKSSMIVPVYLSQSDNPLHERLVYALLDTQSDTTFILDDTCRALCLTGTDVKLSLSTMHAENTIVESSKIKGLVVRGYDSDLKLQIPIAFTRPIMPANRSHIPTAEMAKRWAHLEMIADKLMPLSDCEIGLLIGYNFSRALIPREVIPPVGNGPYAQRTDLGWGIVGIVNPSHDDNCDDIGKFAHRIMAIEVDQELSHFNKSNESKEVLISFGARTKEINALEVAKMMEIDFSDRNIDKPSISCEDRKFLTILQEGIRKVNGHYEMPLPFRHDEPELPNNKTLALQRFRSLRKRIQKNTQYREDYFKSMNDLIDKGFAEKVEPMNTENKGKVWYIPHHGVYNPQKPEKIRIVFDCSAKYNGVSLNDKLLQGPDLTNSLMGVLCRFRQEPIAFVCDIEQMFLQFQVKPEHRDYLRFLWWDDYTDLTKEPKEYRMNSHLFGATSSPGCANFALKQIATDFELEFGTNVADFIRNDFYVDDGLKSVCTVESAIDLVLKGQEMCKMGGLRLHKFLSNSKTVLNRICPNDRASDARSIDILNDKLPTTKTLGVVWCIESDAFQFRISITDKPYTRRGLLSTLSSIYDPLGFIAPIVLVGKRILQDSCFEPIEWDDPLSEQLLQRWELWRRDILNLKSLEIARCVKPIGFGSIVTCEIHHFSDASTTGYGQCSYLRLIDDQDRVHCSLLIGKSRVVPRKPMTIPRLELSAALISVRLSCFLRRELYLEPKEWFWTDSNIVLGYLSNESRRFHVFVANRVQQIRQHSQPYQWKHVNTNTNPADVASRGSTVAELCKTNWFTGPDFLWTTETFEPDNNKPDCELTDPEVRQVKVLSTQTKSTTPSFSSILDRIEYFSDWVRARRAIAICMKLKNALRDKTAKSACLSIDVEDLRQAEIEIIRQVQCVAFKEEIDILRTLQNDTADTRQFAKQRNEAMKGNSSLYRLDPYLDTEGVIRVGGRLRRADLDCGLKHPVILPKLSHVTDLLVRYCHELSKHQGRGLTTNEIRSRGFWIIGCSSVVSKMLSICVICRKLRGQTVVQKMADLPKDRLQPEPPFTYCGVDLFGPWLIKEGRKELKRYGVLFTCLSSRAIHLETANSLDTSSFINALRRFISVRGPVRHLRSDRGTNFVGAERELREAYSEMDIDRIRQYLIDNNCDYVEFKMNVPSASHMGGVWERQIKSVRNVLSTLLNQLGTQLDDESLRTLMCEAAAIVNSRPLTSNNLNDPLSDEPLTPNHLLTMKSKIILPPPGEFRHGDLYSRKRWRRTQYMANQFWDRWRKEFLSNLQSRQKWISKTRNMCIGDIVMIKDENAARNMWRLGKITETYISDDGLVRKARIAIGTSELNSKGVRTVAMTELERPIHKLVLVHETEEFPTEEPSNAS